MHVLKPIRMSVRSADGGSMQSVVFNRGDEEKLVQYAEAMPNLLDFQRLLDMGCIDEIPVTQTLTKEEREMRQKRIQQIEEEKVRERNQQAELFAAEEHQRIQDARNRAEEASIKRSADRARELEIKEREGRIDAGEGPESLE